MTKIYWMLAAAIAFVTVSYYAYATTKKLGVAEHQVGEMVATVNRVAQLAQDRGIEIEDNRIKYTKIETTLRGRIRSLSNVKADACFDKPIPDAAASVLRQLSDTVRHDTGSSTSISDPDSGT